MQGMSPMTSRAEIKSLLQYSLLTAQQRVVKPGAAQDGTAWIDHRSAAHHDDTS
jgi:hypothetical protein